MITSAAALILQGVRSLPNFSADGGRHILIKPVSITGRVLCAEKRSIPSTGEFTPQFATMTVAPSVSVCPATFIGMTGCTFLSSLGTLALTAVQRARYLILNMSTRFVRLGVAEISWVTLCRRAAPATGRKAERRWSSSAPSGDLMLQSYGRAFWRRAANSFRAQSTCTLHSAGALRSRFGPSGPFEPRNPCGVSTCKVLCQRKAVRPAGVCASAQTTQTAGPCTAPRGFVDARCDSPRSDSSMRSRLQPGLRTWAVEQRVLRLASRARACWEVRDSFCTG